MVSTREGVTQMLDGAIMEYVKWFIGIVSTVLMAVLVVFMFKLNEMNAFQQEVNYQIERHGGLTPAAMAELDKHAKEAYGGCLAKTAESVATCVDGTPATETSGFFVKEYVVDDAGNKSYYTRPAGQEARYGTQVRYVLTRQIGDVDNLTMFKPAVIGSSASRVRGAQPTP